MSLTQNNSPAQTIQTPLQASMGNLANDFLLGVALSPSAVAANTTAEQSFAVAGLAASDLISINKPSAQAGLGIVGCRAAANTLYITFSNNTAASITPTAAETYLVKVTRALPQQLTNGLPATLPLSGD